MWADRDETFPGDSVGLSDGHGRVRCGAMHPMGSRGGERGEGVNIFQKVLPEVATVELFCFLCHRKANSYAYTFVAGCTAIFSTFQVITVNLSVSHRGVYG